MKEKEKHEEKRQLIVDFQENCQDKGIFSYGSPRGGSLDFK